MRYYCIDRFEGETAVCETPDGTMEPVPRARLPAGAAEGDLLLRDGNVWKVDEQATAARRAKLQEKRAALQNRRRQKR